MKEMFKHEIGDLLVYKGARYQCVAIQPHQRQDGGDAELAVFHALCAECGEPYEYRTSRYYQKFFPVRRCLDHRGRTRRVATPKFSL